MNNLQELKEGLYWARHKTSDQYSKKEGWTRWVVVQVSGKTPFLEAKIVYDPEINGSEAHLSFSYHIDKWQFGPELNIPSKDYIEVHAAKE